MSDEIPRPVLDFIVRHMHSVAHLEALLLLHGEPHRTWTIVSLAKRLYVGEEQAANVLSDLHQAGLTGLSDGLYRYVAATPVLDGLVAELAAVYARHLIQITNVIHSKPRHAHQFAQAFRLRKDG